MDENELTADERASLERHHPEQLREFDGRRDQNFEPPGSAPKHAPATTDYSGFTREQADAERKRLMGDEGFLKDLRSTPKFSEPAYERLDSLARIASGEKVADKQAGADGDYQPQNVGEYQMNLPEGRSWNDEAAAELQQIKGELFKHGVHAGVANTIFSDFGNYAQSTDEGWRTRIEACAQGVNGKPGGPEIIQQAEAFLNSGLSPALLEAAAIAAGSELGIKELARLGRQLGRKSAH